VTGPAPAKRILPDAGAAARHWRRSALPHARGSCYTAAMQGTIRRLIIVGAVSFFGAAAGVALGNFVAGGPRLTGLEELALFNAMSAATTAVRAEAPAGRAGGRSPGGPTSYHCEGCDAQLYPAIDITAVADTMPLPPYVPHDTDLSTPGVTERPMARSTGAGAPDMVPPAITPVLMPPD
jgi:hypothetical protein